MTGLPDDWRQPSQVMLEEAWANNPQRELLDARKREADENGDPVWRAGYRVEGDGWIEIWQEPVDPRDGREGIRVAAWPLNAEMDPLMDARAVADEHRDD